MDTLARKMNRVEEKNYQLQEAVSGTYINGGRVEDKFGKNLDIINSLMEKINNVDKKMLRIERTNSETKQKVDSGGGKNNNDSRGGKRHRHNGGDNGIKFVSFEEQRAEVAAQYATKNHQWIDEPPRQALASK